MTEKEKTLCARVAKQLNMFEYEVKLCTLNHIIEMLLTKMENDMFDIEDMFTHLQNMKEEK